MIMYVINLLPEPRREAFRGFCDRYSLFYLRQDISKSDKFFLLKYIFKIIIQTYLFNKALNWFKLN